MAELGGLEEGADARAVLSRGHARHNEEHPESDGGCHSLTVADVCWPKGTWWLLAGFLHSLESPTFNLGGGA